MSSLSEEYKKYHELSPSGLQFLQNLESSISQDLWGSAGGHWSEASIQSFRSKAMMLLAQYCKETPSPDFAKSWALVVRDFHQNYWGEKRLQKKERKPLSEDDRIFKELFSYIWVLLQAVFVTKTAVFYFGIKNAESESGEGKIYLFLAIAFSFVSLTWFAYRKSKNKSDKE